MNILRTIIRIMILPIALPVFALWYLMGIAIFDEESLI